VRVRRDGISGLVAIPGIPGMDGTRSMSVKPCAFNYERVPQNWTELTPGAKLVPQCSTSRNRMYSRLSSMPR